MPERAPWRRYPWVLTAAGGLTAAVLVSGYTTLRADPSAAPATLEPAASDAGLVATESDRAAPCQAMTVAEQASLTMVLGLPGVTDADDPLVDLVAAVGVGGVMLRDDNLLDEDQARDLVEGLRARLGAKLVIAVDEEGGRVTSLRGLGDRTPSARRLGNDGPDAAYDAGIELGERISELDIDLVLGPVVDLDDGAHDGMIGDRSFGGDAEAVVDAAGAFIAGVRDNGVGVTLKHFPGHAGEADPHLGNVIFGATMDELREDRLVPFRRLAVAADAVMVGHVSYPRALGPGPATLDSDTYQLLRELGFGGVALTDALGMGAIHSRWGFDVAPAMALAAGADAVLVTQGHAAAEIRSGIVSAVAEGRLPGDRLTEAAARVLALRGDDALTLCA